MNAFCFVCITFFLLLVVSALPWIIPYSDFKSLKIGNNSKFESFSLRSVLIVPTTLSVLLLLIYFWFWRDSWHIVMNLPYQD